MHVRVAARSRTVPARFFLRRIGMLRMGAGVVLVVRPRTSVRRGGTLCDRRVRGDDHHVLDRPWRCRRARSAAGTEDDENEGQGAEHDGFYGVRRPLLPWLESSGISATAAGGARYGRFGSEPSLARAMLFALEPEVETERVGEQLTSQ